MSPPPARTPDRSTDPAQALAALSDAMVAFADATSDSVQTLRLALDLLIEVTAADAGAIAVPGDEGSVPRLLAERALEDAGPISMTVLASALADRHSQATINEPPASESVFDAEITSILCIPVRRQGQTLAAVYLDRRGPPKFDEVARRLAISFASMLALALDLTRKVEQTQERAEEARAVAAHVHGFWHFGDLVTHSHAFAGCLQVAEKVAPSDTSLLILGETGSGKEHLARCIHAASPRRARPFLAINCAALPESLIESELFGHERGSFTGATETRRGKFELAEGGTLFLDEIGDLPLPLQPKFLRALDARQIARIGGTGERPVDVRIVAATHRDLKAEADAGRFREDLYYRLNVVTLRIPMLCERLEDIAPLAKLFLELECRRSGRRLQWSEAALRRLGQHAWPGNVRELKNLVEKLCVLSEAPVIETKDLESHFSNERAAAVVRPGPRTSKPVRRRLQRAEHQIADLVQAVEQLREQLAGTGAVRTDLAADPPDAAVEAEALEGQRGLREQMDAAARVAISQAFGRAGSLSGAARELGISRQHLWSQCKRLGLKRVL